MWGDNGALGPEDFTANSSRCLNLIDADGNQFTTSPVEMNNQWFDGVRLKAILAEDGGGYVAFAKPKLVSTKRKIDK